MRIGRYPQGYLELLAAKANGSTPSEIADQVMPVLDVSPYYGLGAFQVRSASTAVVNATGFFGDVASSLVVPNGELWRVHNVTILSTALAAATAYRLRAAAYLTNLSNAYRLAPGLATYVATERPGFGWDAPYPALFGAGWAFGLWCEQLTLGTSQAFTIAVHYDKLS